MDRSRLDPIIKHILPLFTKATLWAARCKLWYSLSIVLAYLLAAAAVTVAVIQVVFFKDDHWIIAFELMAMIVSVGGVALALIGYWHDRWLYARHLAERLRIAIYILVLPDDPSQPLEEVSRMLPFYEGTDLWLGSVVRRAAMRVVNERNGSMGENPADDTAFGAVKDFIVKEWLIKQYEYQDKTAHGKHARHGWGRLGILSLFGLTFLAAWLHFLHVAHGLLGQIITASAIALPAWAAALHGLFRHFESERLAARSQQMKHAISRLIRHTEHTTDFQGLRVAVREAAHVMGLESHEWLIQLRFGPPEVVV